MPGKKIGVTVMVDDAHRAELNKVAGELARRGFTVRQELGELGVLTGDVPEEDLEGLSSVAGVIAVEKERTDYRPQGGAAL